MSLRITIFEYKSLSENCEIYEKVEYDSFNITHNLSTMAKKTNLLYDVLWGIGNDTIVKANSILNDLELGLQELKNKPDYYKQFNASNGWGLYEHFVPFVEKVINCIKEHPDSWVEVSV